MNEQMSNVMMQIYQANMLLMQRIGELTQAAGVQWSTKSQTTVAESVRDFSGEMRELLAVKDFPVLIALQFNLVRRHWDRNQELLQQAFKLSEKNPDLGEKFREAIEQWQQEVSPLISGISGMSWAMTPWTEYMTQFQKMWVQEDSTPSPKSRTSRK